MKYLAAFPSKTFLISRRVHGQLNLSVSSKKAINNVSVHCQWQVLNIYILALINQKSQIKTFKLHAYLINNLMLQKIIILHLQEQVHTISHADGESFFGGHFPFTQKYEE